ncbi:MAG TPA: Fic family protein [Solirubrobacteraceae bacterium]|nr:Fic family protein [Solirubrobacteraceae bacterium]
MARVTTTFSLDDQPEVFFSTTPTSRAIRRLYDAGRVRHVAGRLYTRNLSDPLADVLRRRVWDVAAGYFPGAVIADRTAFELRPAGEEGSIFLCSGTRRVVRLPGLVLNCRHGAGPVEGDQPFLAGGLHLSSWPRRFLENMRPSRERGGARRTLSATEIEAQLQAVLDNQGEDELNRLRDDARRLVPALGAERECERLSEAIGGLLGTQPSRLVSPGARARRAGVGWDERRLPLFDALVSELGRHLPVDRPQRPEHMGAPFAFFEAYFSNFIEGTEFVVSEAEQIVFAGVVPADRPQDAHDVLGTFDLVSDPAARASVPRDIASLERIIRSAHARLLAARPEIAPGEYKTRANRAGQTEFVAPPLVRGTLRRGLERYLSLPPGFQRAVFAMFLVSEVHPFADGNGRVARVLTNAELTSAGQQRLIVPTVLRDDYLYALRAMSRLANPVPLIRVLDRAQELCVRLDWRQLDSAEAQLRAAHAFDTPAEAEAAGVRLRLPNEVH